MSTKLFPAAVALLAGLAMTAASFGQSAQPTDPAQAPQKNAEPKPAPPPPSAPPTTVVLTTGEVLRGEIVSQDDQAVHLKHPVMGEIVIPRASIKSLVTTPKDAPMTLPDPKPPIVPAPPPPPDPESFFAGWIGHVDAGLAGSDGNSQTLSGHAEIGMKRLTAAMDTVWDVSYFYETSDSTKTKSRGEANIRNDWKFDDSPWGIFAQGRQEFDEFQNYKWRASASAGPSYTFVKDDTMLLRGRIGAGIAYEWAGPDPKHGIIPEGLAGLDFTYKIDERQSVFANLEYLPSLKNPPAYRADLKAGYQIVVDPALKLLLKLGMDDRYDSDPGSGKKRNDIDYFVTIGWEF